MAETPWFDGKRLRWRRLSKGLNQSQLAILAGVSPSYIWKLEAGTAQPRAAKAAQITAALEIPLTDVMLKPPVARRAPRRAPRREAS